MQERYRPQRDVKGLTTGMPEAEIRHFKPESADGRDRFGNRFFASPDLAYLDSSLDRTKAGILVSKEGEQFIKLHPGILSRIDHALQQLENEKGEFTSKEPLNLGPGETLQAKETGGQSNFYILTIGGEKYAIKTHTPARYFPINGVEKNSDVNQPYVNEMLQTQSMAADLKKDFDKLQVEMSTFLFASGQVSCTKFEKDESGEMNNGEYIEMIEKRLIVLDKLTKNYLDKKQKNDDPLWKKIKIDRKWDFDIISARDCFVLRKDGKMVWIDPFFFDPWNY